MTASLKACVQSPARHVPAIRALRSASVGDPASAGPLTLARGGSASPVPAARLHPADANPRPRGLEAFTLMELLVVIGIIAALTVSSMPAIRSLTQANTLASGSRQILDELNLARQQALNSRRTIYLVLVPPTMRAHHAELLRMPAGPRRDQALRQFTNLVSGQYTSYALFTKRTVGDQPGRHSPRYLDPGWKRLPDGMFFATNRFVDLGSSWTNVVNLGLDPTNRALPHGWFPFPTAFSPPLRMPYIAFEPSGRLAYDEPPRQGRPEVGITLSRGSIFYPKDGQGRLIMNADPDVVTTPRGNRTDVVVNWITGRPRILEVKVQ